MRDGKCFNCGENYIKALFCHDQKYCKKNVILRERRKRRGKGKAKKNKSYEL